MSPVFILGILIVDAYATACFGLFLFVYIYRKFLAMES